jgi:signal transduction histidine kinase
VARFEGVQATMAALALVLGGGAIGLLLAMAFAAWRAARPGARALEKHLWAVSDALGDPAFVLDARGRIVAASRGARARFGDDLGGRSVEDVLGSQAALLLRGVARGPAAARIDLGGRPAAANAVVERISSRPARDLVVLRVDPEPRPPPLPAPRAPRVELAPRQPGLRAGLGAVAAALLPPVERASTAAGLLRLTLPMLPGRGGATGPSPSDELRRLEAELAALERRLRWLQASGREVAVPVGPVDLAALVAELAGSAPHGRRLRTQLTPARALADAGRLRTALREILRSAGEAVPAGGELLVRVAARSGAVVLELVPAAAAAEAVALARTLLVPDGGEVELEAPPGRAGVCRILLPAS